MLCILTYRDKKGKMCLHVTIVHRLKMQVWILVAE